MAKPEKTEKRVRGWIQALAPVLAFTLGWGFVRECVTGTSSREAEIVLIDNPSGNLNGNVIGDNNYIVISSNEKEPEPSGKNLSINNITVNPRSPLRDKKVFPPPKDRGIQPYRKLVPFDEPIYDETRKLEWLVNEIKTGIWEKAPQIANNINTLRNERWRIPNSRELVTLARYLRSHNIPCDESPLNDWFWSSNTESMIYSTAVNLCNSKSLPLQKDDALSIVLVRNREE